MGVWVWVFKSGPFQEEKPELSFQDCSTVQRLVLWKQVGFLIGDWGADRR